VLLYVYVEDADEHCARSCAAGAEIVYEPREAKSLDVRNVGVAGAVDRPRVRGIRLRS